ncbi:MAG: D-aminoacyl-tRNA deacylase, partial [Candidatus Dormibacteraceae bacterium]
MRAVIQRVTSARVAWRQGLIDHAHEIGPGVVVLVAVASTDSDADANRMADRIVTLRIFNGAHSKPAHSLLDAAGEAMV